MESNLIKNSPKPIIVANWKMNGLLKDSSHLIKKLINILGTLNGAPYDMVICPQFPILMQIFSEIRGTGIVLGAQDCHHELLGAYTGNVSPMLLKEVGCNYVIIGHSERRQNQFENDALVGSKAKAAIGSNLSAILCVGEDQRDYEKGNSGKIIQKQLVACWPENASSKNIVVAYEPIWAIGSGKVASIEHIQNIHKLIRKEISGTLNKKNSENYRIIYGGSLNDENAEEIINLPDVNGGLIGGASLNAAKFAMIANLCNK